MKKVKQNHKTLHEINNIKQICYTCLNVCIYNIK